MRLIAHQIRRLRALRNLLSGLRLDESDKAAMEANVAAMATMKASVAALQANWNSITAQLVQAAARSIAATGDHRQIPAYEIRDPEQPVVRSLKIGLFDNLANQAYITARALRRLGHDVELVVQENWADIYPMNRPQWEECEFENIDTSKFDPILADWNSPNFVRYRPFSYELYNRYAGRLDAVGDVAALYFEEFGKRLPPDLALLLAQNMGHWDYIRAMGDYDVVLLSMTAVLHGPFSPRPTVVCPLGSEVYTRAFDEDMGGLLCRAGFRQAAHLSLPETDYFAYVDRMETKAPRSFMPLIVDTDIYRPGEEPELRAEWQGKVGGEHFLLGVCRQDWAWKGSDRLIRGFARFRAANPEAASGWRLLLQSWGTDLEASRALVTELGLDDVTLWLTMCSKPLLRRRQRAADAVADQFVMEGYGASVLESLAAAKPVIMRPVPEAAKHHFRTAPPPFVGATTEDDIAAALAHLADPQARKAAGLASRHWVEAEHGYKTLGPLYMAMFEKAARYPTGVAATTAKASGTLS
jgi:glycosyltransferase involved in cell wall biosynthesis